LIKRCWECIETTYPYNKYAQVAVEDFEFGGIENISYTTLKRDILSDKKASLDYTSDYVISHESQLYFLNVQNCLEKFDLFVRSLTSSTISDKLPEAVLVLQMFSYFLFLRSFKLRITLFVKESFMHFHE
jgi:hypothetical protein